MPIPENLRQSAVTPPPSMDENGTVQEIDMNMVVNDGQPIDKRPPLSAILGQEGSVYAGHHRLKRPGDWAKGGKL